MLNVHQKSKEPAPGVVPSCESWCHGDGPEPTEEEVHETHDASRGLKTPPPGQQARITSQCPMTKQRLLEGCGRIHDAPAPQVVERKQPNIVEAPSLDVPGSE